MGMENLWSALGIPALLALAWLCSSGKRRVNVRVLLWGLGLQFVVALAIFQAPGVGAFLLWFNKGFNRFIECAQAGPAFLLGPLVDASNTGGFVLLLQGLPMVVFFAALMGVLYYLRIMPCIIRGFAYVFTSLMRISGAESLCVSSSIFVGSEALTTVQPFLARMTRSELFTIMTAGMATIASTMLGVYVFFLRDTFPGIAGHLVSASLLSAPAAVIMAKLMLPELEQPETLGKRVQVPSSGEDGLMEALVNGAMAGVKLLVGIAALLLAMVGMLALLNAVVAFLGHLAGQDWSLERGLGLIFYPFALLIGIPPSDALWAGLMLGKRMVLTELPVYQELGAAMSAPGFAHSPRAVVILVYALCGFAHVPSVAVYAGGLCALAPERRNDIASLAFRALIAATLACLLTGAVAGMFYTDQSGVLMLPAP